MLWDTQLPHLDEEPDGERCGVPSTEGVLPGEEAGQNCYQPSTLNDWPLQSIAYLLLHTEVLLVAHYGC